jgi:hypothetical protein
MIKRYQHGAALGIGIGICLMASGGSTARMGPEWVSPGLAIGLMGWAFLLFGCVAFAQAKGYSPWFGLFGLLMLLGPVILFFFADRHPTLPGAGQPGSSPFAGPAAPPTSTRSPTSPAHPPLAPQPIPPTPQMAPAAQSRPKPSGTGLKVAVLALAGIAGLVVLLCAGVLVGTWMHFHATYRQWDTQTQPPSSQWPDGPASLKVGDRLEAEWAGDWYPVRVVEMMPGGWARVEWTSRDDLPEMVLPPSQLRAPADAPEPLSPPRP